MEITENGARIQLLGDPHLGRSFVNGVPLHRRGERERMVWEAFLEGLHAPDGADHPDLHICLGDLFDKWIVSFDLILKTAAAYREVADLQPTTTFYILKGNHDWIRDLERRSAFDVFAALVANVDNIHVVDKPIWLLQHSIALCPWHPLEPAEKANFPKANILFGHFDVEFGDHNMVPTKLHYDRIYTGHDHKARRLTRDGTEVVVVGSMQPYAHGEEPDDSLYVTVRAEDITDPVIYRDKCLRILGRFDKAIDCLQLTFKQDPQNADDGELDDVSLGDFDFEKIFAEVFAEVGVSADRTADVLGQYHTRREANGT